MFQYKVSIVILMVTFAIWVTSLFRNDHPQTYQPGEKYWRWLAYGLHSPDYEPPEKLVNDANQNKETHKWDGKEIEWRSSSGGFGFSYASRGRSAGKYGEVDDSRGERERGERTGDQHNSGQSFPTEEPVIVANKREKQLLSVDENKDSTAFTMTCPHDAIETLWRPLACEHDSIASGLHNCHETHNWCPSSTDTSCAENMKQVDDESEGRTGDADVDAKAEEFIKMMHRHFKWEKICDQMGGYTDQMGGYTDTCDDE